MDEVLKTQLEKVGKYGADTVAAFLSENLTQWERMLLDTVLPQIIDGLEQGQKNGG